jgi:hypothetical protein
MHKGEAMDRIALISDVHGNLTALQAVLAAVDARDTSYHVPGPAS